MMIPKKRLARLIDDPKSIEYLADKDVEEIILEAGRILDKENNLIHISGEKAIFVGDTHGDFDATQKILLKYLDRRNTLVFLGDYVDRGKNSLENINYLLISKILYPENLILLQGNHDAVKFLKFYPADFWDSLSKKFYNLYSDLLARLPLVATTKNGIIALHGALPDVSEMYEINKIERGCELWRQITWGDFYDTKGDYLGTDPMTGRPKFGRDYFNRVMHLLGMNILIRSHQPSANTKMFNNRCITIFTSYAYSSERRIAISDTDKDIKDVNDLSIIFV